jgi:mycofactocin biosynthesis protein MftB
VSIDQAVSRASSTFDAALGWRLNPRVSVRPEPFGALLYHFGTRRLSFVKDRRLLDVVLALGDHESARAACLASGVSVSGLERYEQALAHLAAGGVLTAREESS